MDTPCPDRSLLRAYAVGASPSGETPFLEAHLARCALCVTEMSQLLLAFRELDGPAAAGSSRARPAPRVLTRRWALPAAAAAAVALICAGAAAWLSSGGSAPRHPALPGEESVAGRSERLEGGAAGRAVALPDGTRLRLSPGAAAHFGPPGAGERCRLVLERGELEAAVEKGRGEFRIGSDAGEIRVLGTRFRAKAFPLPGAGLLPGLRESPVLYVEMREGRVLLRNPLGDVELSAAQKGLSLGGAVPLSLEKGGGWEHAVESFARQLRREGGAISIEPGREPAAAILIATLAGDGAPPDRWERLLAPEHPPEIRLSCALLAGLSGFPGASAPREILNAFQNRENR